MRDQGVKSRRDPVMLREMTSAGRAWTGKRDFSGMWAGFLKGLVTGTLAFVLGFVVFSVVLPPDPDPASRQDPVQIAAPAPVAPAASELAASPGDTAPQTGADVAGVESPGLSLAPGDAAPAPAGLNAGGETAAAPDPAQAAAPEDLSMMPQAAPAPSATGTGAETGADDAQTAEAATQGPGDAMAEAAPDAAPDAAVASAPPMTTDATATDEPATDATAADATATDATAGPDAPQEGAEPVAQTPPAPQVGPTDHAGSTEPPPAEQAPADAMPSGQAPADALAAQDASEASDQSAAQAPAAPDQVAQPPVAPTPPQPEAPSPAEPVLRATPPRQADSAVLGRLPAILPPASAPAEAPAARRVTVEAPNAPPQPQRAEGARRVVVPDAGAPEAAPDTPAMPRVAEGIRRVTPPQPPAAGQPETLDLGAPAETPETVGRPAPQEPDLSLPAYLRFAARHDAPMGSPVLALVLIDAPQAEGALTALPFAITIALDPLDADAPRRATAYRAAGHEIAIFARDIPPRATASDIEVTLSAYRDALPQAVAILDPPQDGFQTDRRLSQQIVAWLDQDGLGLITHDRGLNPAQQSAQSAGVAEVALFRQIDSQNENEFVIRRYLDRAGFRAQQVGRAAVLGRADHPDTLAALLAWRLEGRATQAALVPVSAVLN
jgi:hypothetical protein